MAPALTMPRVRYNAPVVLTFSLLATAVTALAIALGTERVIAPYFSASGRVSPLDPLWYVRLSTHVLGHSGWDHLLANVTVILLVGPLLEDRFGTRNTARMILITAVVTGLLNALLSDRPVHGASGVAFMLILLASLSTHRRGEIPLTFLLVAALFLGREVLGALRPGDDRVSQFAHVAGGACGVAFGLLHRRY